MYELTMSNITNTTDTSTSTAAYRYDLTESILIVTAMVLMSGISLFGNTMVFIAYIKVKSLQCATNYFILSLAASDFIVALFVVNVHTMYMVVGWPYTVLDYNVCLLWLCVDYWVFQVSVASVLLVTGDRFLSIKYPIRYRIKRTDTVVKNVIAANWIVSFIMWIPLILIYGYKTETRATFIREGVCDVGFADVIPATVFGHGISYILPNIIIIIFVVDSVRILLNLDQSDLGKKRKKMSMAKAIRKFTTLKSMTRKSSKVLTSTTSSLDVSPILGHGFSKTSLVNNNGNNDARNVDKCRRNTFTFSEPTHRQQCVDSTGSTLKGERNALREPSRILNAINVRNGYIADMLRKIRIKKGLTYSFRDAPLFNSPCISTQTIIQIDKRVDDSIVETSNSARVQSLHEKTILSNVAKNTLDSTSNSFNNVRICSIDATPSGTIGEQEKHHTMRRPALTIDITDYQWIATFNILLGVSFVINILPLGVMAITRAACNDLGTACVSQEMWFFGYIMCYLNSMFNPICYAFGNKVFKRAFISILRGKEIQ